MAEKKGAITDSTIARIAGNLCSGFDWGRTELTEAVVIEVMVARARMIAAEVERTKTAEA